LQADTFGVDESRAHRDMNGRTLLEAADMRSLSARVLELERERSDAREQVRLLEALQNTFTRIAITRTPDEVVAQMLAAAYDPLGFSRAIYFNVDRRTGVEARWQVDRSEVVEPSHEAADLRSGSQILSVLRGDCTDGVGTAGDLSAPLVDVRGWYVLSALERSEGALGLLYVDGHRKITSRLGGGSRPRAHDRGRSVARNSILFAKTQELATRDPLTGLFNRRAFAERLLAQVAACGDSGRGLTYVMIDVDDFKHVNDSRGHAYGDAVLKRLADTLMRNSRAEDVVGRFAGDEFVVLLADVDPELARTLVARLSNDLKTQDLSCSLGAAIFPRDARDAASLLAAADRALYATKAAGKNGFSFA